MKWLSDVQGKFLMTLLSYWNSKFIQLESWWPTLQFSLGWFLHRKVATARRREKKSGRWWTMPVNRFLLALIIDLFHLNTLAVSLQPLIERFIQEGPTPTSYKMIVLETFALEPCEALPLADGTIHLWAYQKHPRTSKEKSLTCAPRQPPSFLMLPLAQSPCGALINLDPTRKEFEMTS